MKKLLSNLREKVIFEGLVPTTICSVLGIFIIVIAIFRYFDAEKIEKLASLSEASSSLVHDLQIERGITAGYLSSERDNSSKIKENLISQHTLSDKRINHLHQQIHNIVSIDNKFSQTATETKKLLDNIAIIRTDVLNRNTTPNVVIPKYNHMIDVIIDINTKISKSISHKAIAEEIDSLSSFSQFKNNVGIERALLNIIFTKGEPVIDVYYKIHNIIGREAAFYSIFIKNANPKIIDSINTKKETTAYTYPLTLRKKGLSGDINLISTITPQEWFEAQTKKINLLKQIEDETIEEMLSDSKKYKQQSFIIGISLAVLFLVFTIFQLYTKSVIRKFKRIKNINEAAMLYSNSAVVICDSKFVVTFINNEGVKLFNHFIPGSTQESIQGHNLLEIHQFPEDFITNLSCDAPCTHTIKVNNLYLKASISPIFTEGNEKSAISIDWEDRTNEVTAELEIQRLLREFELGNLSDRIDVSNKTGFF